MASELPADTPGMVWHRLHGTTLLFRIGKQARALVVPVIIILVLAREGSWEFWLLAMFVPGVLYELFKYFTLRYRFTDDEIIVRQGLVFRNERHIRFQRVQNIDLSQNPLHRYLKVADVRIETAGGSEPEAQLQVLSLEAVAAMRERVFAVAGEAATTAERSEAEEAPAPLAAQVLLRIPTLELVKLGLISNRGMVFVFIAAGLGWEFDLFERIEDVALSKYEVLFETVMAQSPLVVGLAGVATLIVGLLLLRALSVAWMILRFHGYVLERVGEDLRISSGLLTRTSATIPRHRIQFISVHEPLLARRLGRARIRLETAGGFSQEQEASAMSRKWFVPILPRGEVGRIVGELFPDLDLVNVPWQPLAPRAKERMIRKAVIVAVLLTLGCTLALLPWGAAAGLVLVPLAVWHAVVSARRIRWARTPVGMLFRSGVLTWKLSATFYNKMQVMAMSASPFDRRWGMASLKIDTAGAGPADHRIDIPYLPRDVVRGQLGELLARAQQAAFRI